MLDNDHLAEQSSVIDDIHSIMALGDVEPFDVDAILKKIGPIDFATIDSQYVHGDGSLIDEPANQQSPTFLGTIVVNGQRQQLSGFISAGWGGYATSYSGGSSDQFVWQPDYSCGDYPDGTHPGDHMLARLRGLVDQLDDRLSMSDINQDFEWGAIIYEMPDGRIYYTQPVSIGSPGTIGFSYGPSYIPDGATIMAWYHTHPYVPGTGDQAGLSDTDYAAYSTMLIQSFAQNNRFSVSSTLMTYVKDNLTGKTYEFDQTDDVGSEGVEVNRCS